MRAILILPGALLLLATAAPQVTVAQERVGRISGVEGEVQIDAFGYEVYIDAKAGDVVYDRTVIRTEHESWVTLELDGRQAEIGPNSTTRVAAYLSDRRTGSAPGLFSRIIRSIAESLAPPEETIADFGGRATSVPGTRSLGDLLVTDVEVDREFEQGRASLDAGDYRTAVEHLRRIDYPEDGEFGITEYYVALTSALIGFGDLDAATQAAFEFARADPSVDRVGLLPDRLRLLAAISAYYAGNDPIAAATADAYISSVGVTAADPQALAIRVLLLRDSDPPQALELERAARSQRPDIDWAALLGR